MNTKRLDIHGSLILNSDQEAFRLLLSKAVPKLVKYTKSIDVGKQTNKPGYEYQDYVITIKMSHDRNSYEIFRNRNGALVFAVIDGKTVSINHEYVFIEDHIASLMKDQNG
ncbi:MAG: hypothetical protein MJZ25_03615 [Fibrobacter sp.]|nr:hypothetical protein [Fibrobacter sp.]